MAQTTLHLRSETKYLERRTPRRSTVLLVPPYCLSSNRFTVTPTTTKTLIDSGYMINVEKSTGRVFRDEEYEAAGANLVPEGTWASAPKDNIIVGLKELPQDDGKLVLPQSTGFQAHPDPLTSSPPT